MPGAATRAPTASTPTARRATFPTSTYEGTNYWVDPVFTPAAAPGQVDRRERHRRRRASATVTWTAPAQRRRRRPPTRSRRTSARPRRRRRPSPASPPATTRHDHGPHPRHDLHVHGPGRPTRAGPGRCRRRPTPVTPPALAAPAAPTGVTASRPRSAGAGRAGPRRPTKAAAPITGYTVTPYVGSDGADAGAGQRARRHLGDRHRPDQRHHLHVQGRRRPTRSARASVGGVERGHARRTRSSTSRRPTIVDSGDRSSVELGVKFTADTRAARSPGSASTRRPPTPARTSAACGAPAGHAARLRRRSRTRPPRAGSRLTFSTPVAITPGTTYVAGYFAPNGHYSRHRRAFALRPGSTTGR